MANVSSDSYTVGFEDLTACNYTMNLVFIMMNY